MTPPSPPPKHGLLASLDDTDLLLLIVGRRQEALSELYDRYASMLLALAHRVLGSREDAEEVLQEVLVHVWENATSYDPERSAVSTWLVLLVRSRAIDRLRNRQVVDRTHSAAEAEKPQAHTSPEGARNVLSLERQRRVREVMAALPPEQREVLELAFFEGKTQREIAAASNTPLGTVKTRSLLAMKKLRAALADEIGELL